MPLVSGQTARTAALKTADKDSEWKLAINSTSHDLPHNPIADTDVHTEGDEALAKGDAAFINGDLSQAIKLFKDGLNGLQRGLTTAQVMRRRLLARISVVRAAHRDGVAEGCRHNASVASKLGQPELANSWRMLQAMTSTPTRRRDSGLIDAVEMKAQNIPQPVGLARAAGLGPVRFHSHYCNLRITVNLIVISEPWRGLLDGMLGGHVAKLSKWFACERGDADVQSAVTLLLLFGRPHMWEPRDGMIDNWPQPPPLGHSHRQGEMQRDLSSESPSRGHGTKPAGSSPVEAWSHAYIELLQRHKLFAVATRVAHVSVRIGLVCAM